MRNAAGDEIDSTTPLYTDIPASLVERSKVVLDPATQTPRTVRDIVCVIPSWTDVVNTDRIQDETSGYVYAIEDVTYPPTLMGAPVDEVLTLRRVTGVTA